jgi:hypothetical protein
MPRTPVAVLGTLAEFHREPIPYDLRTLVELVTTLQPEFLCLDMTLEQWERRTFGDLPPEYRDALLPLASQTDIVVVPIAGAHPPQEPNASGWRGRINAQLRCWLAKLNRTAPSADAVNSGPRHWIADVLYATMLLLTDANLRAAWRSHTGALVQNVLAVARRDPHATILVVVNVRHCHHIRKALRAQADVRLLPYAELATARDHSGVMDALG